MMTRRRAMMAGIALPEWDYEWKTADNVYPSEDGWTKTVSGTGNEYKSTYYQMRASKNNDYIQYTWPYTYTKGAIQISFRLATGYGSALRLYLSNGTSAIGVRMNYNSTASNQRFYLMDGTGYSDMTPLATFKRANTYNLELRLDNGFGDVLLRDYSGGGDFQTIASGIDCSEIVSQASMGTASTAMRVTAFTGSNQAWTIYYIRMRFGRTT